MKPLFQTLCVIAFMATSTLWAQSSRDPLGENLFPPELIMQKQSEIDLSDEQRETLMAEIQKFQDAFAEKRGDLDKEVDALAALLGKERVDEAAALAQFDEIQKQERDIKRTHLSLLVALKNKLTAEQQAKLHRFKKDFVSGKSRPPGAIPEKMEKVKAGVEDWQNSGRNPSPIAEIMQEFDPLMKQGKFKEAEAVLDRALKVLREEK